MPVIEIFKLFGRVLIDNDQAEKSLASTEKKGQGLVGTFGKVIGTAVKVGAAIAGAAVAAGGALFALTNKVSAQADAIAKNSEKMGISTDAYQEMDYWASQNGLSTGDMERAVGRLNQRIGAAAEGNEKYSKVLERLGINMDDVREGTVSTEEAMGTAIQSLSEIENAQERSAVAAELFGTKLARELMPALADGSLSLEEAKEKAHELGIVLDEEGIRAAEQYQDSMDDMQRSLGAVWQQIGLRLIPIFQNMLDWVMEHMPQIQAFFQRVFDAVEIAVQTGIDWVRKFISWVRQWFEDNEETTGSIKELFVDLFESITGFISAFVSWAEEFWEKHGDKIIAVLTAAWDIVSSVFEGALKIITGIFDIFAGVFSGDWEKMWDGVEQVLSAIMETIKGVVKGAVDAILALFGTDLDSVKGIISGIFNNVKDTVLGIWGDITSGIRGFVNRIIDAMNGMIRGINRFEFKAPDWVPIIGGRGWSPSISLIPRLAEGGIIQQTGAVMVGEEGPEILDLPRGAKVTPLDHAYEKSEHHVIFELRNPPQNIDHDTFKAMLKEMLQMPDIARLQDYISKGNIDSRLRPQGG